MFLQKFNLTLFLFLVIIVKQTAFSETVTSPAVQTATEFGNVRPVAELLFTKYLFPFELTSILLLVAIVGAVLMAKKGKTEQEGDI